MCIKCDADPKSHSFFKMGRQGDTSLYYTCPGDATDHKTADVLTHYREVLEQNGDGKWVFIFDAKGFTMYHSTRVATAKGLLTIFNEYGDTLQELRILHANTFVKTLFSLIRPLTPASIYRKIVWK